MEEMIEITKAEYERMPEPAAWVDALEMAGVDNWEGYDYARELYQEGQA